MEDPAPAWTLGTAYTCQLCGQVTCYCHLLVTINCSTYFSNRQSWALTCSVTTWKSATSQPTRLTGMWCHNLSKILTIFRSRLHPELVQHGSFFFCKICFTSITWDTNPLTDHFSATHDLSLKVGPNELLLFVRSEFLPGILQIAPAQRTPAKTASRPKTPENHCWSQGSGSRV